MAQNPKVIIACATTDLMLTPSMLPHLPVTLEEISDSAMSAAELGAVCVPPPTVSPSTSANRRLVRRLRHKRNAARKTRS